MGDGRAERGEGHDDEGRRGDLVVAAEPVAVMRASVAVVPRRPLHDAAAQADLVDFANVQPTDGENQEQNTDDDEHDSEHAHRV